PTARSPPARSAGGPARSWHPIRPAPRPRLTVIHRTWISLKLLSGLGLRTYPGVFASGCGEPVYVIHSAGRAMKGGWRDATRRAGRIPGRVPEDCGAAGLAARAQWVAGRELGRGEARGRGGGRE